MPEPLPAPRPSIYQLRVVLRGISPIIWRCLLMRSDTALATLATWATSDIDHDDYRCLDDGHDDPRYDHERDASGYAADRSEGREEQGRRWAPRR